MCRRESYAAIVIALAAMPLHARDEGLPEGYVVPRYEIRQATGEVVVDGVLDEQAWRAALSFQLPYEVQPGDNVPAPVETTCYMAYTESHLYVAFHALDPDPDSIRAHLSDRDRAFDNDWVGISVDTFNDERRGFELLVNPLGVQMDLSINETSQDREDTAWDAIWSSKARIVEDGYVVEMAIPFTSFRFQRHAGLQTWGLAALRNWPRSSRHILTNVALDRGRNCTYCQASKVTGFEGVEPGRNLELVPTVTASRTDEREEITDQELVAGDPGGEIGLTVLWGLTPSATLAATLNPDFSQIEADAGQLDVNNTFALFFPERRPFFLEGADFFATHFDAVYTRNVSEPNWGLKLTGKEQRNALGVFAADDATTNILIPGSEGSETETLEAASLDGVLRYRRDLGQVSTLGALITARRADGYANGVAGLDGRFRLGKTDTLDFQALYSRTEYPDQITEDFDQPEGQFSDPALYLAYWHVGRNWEWSAQIRDVGTDFRADMGFMPQVDFRSGEAFLNHSWRGTSANWYDRLLAGGRYEYKTTQDGELLENAIFTWVGFDGPLQSYFRFSPVVRERGYEGEIFDETFVRIRAGFQPTGSFELGVWGNLGDTIDFDNVRPAQQTYLTPWFRWNLGRHLRLFLSETYQRLEVEEGRLFTASLTEFRGVYQFTVRSFLRAIVQYETVNRDPSLYEDPVAALDENLLTQILFAYKINPKTVLFLGYSDGFVGEDDIDLTRESRALFLKIGYSWVL